jgi:hypothetical protein
LTRIHNHCNRTPTELLVRVLAKTFPATITDNPRSTKVFAVPITFSLGYRPSFFPKYHWNRRALYVVIICTETFSTAPEHSLHLPPGPVTKCVTGVPTRYPTQCSLRYSLFSSRLPRGGHCESTFLGDVLIIIKLHHLMFPVSSAHVGVFALLIGNNGVKKPVIIMIQ